MSAHDKRSALGHSERCYPPATLRETAQPWIDPARSTDNVKDRGDLLSSMHNQAETGLRPVLFWHPKSNQTLANRKWPHQDRGSCISGLHLLLPTCLMQLRRMPNEGEHCRKQTSPGNKIKPIKRTACEAGTLCQRNGSKMPRSSRQSTI